RIVGDTVRALGEDRAGAPRIAIAFERGQEHGEIDFVAVAVRSGGDVVYPHRLAVRRTAGERGELPRGGVVGIREVDVVPSDADVITGSDDRGGSVVRDHLHDHRRAALHVGIDTGTPERSVPIAGAEVVLDDDLAVPLNPRRERARSPEAVRRGAALADRIRPIGVHSGRVGEERDKTAHRAIFIPAVREPGAVNLRDLRAGRSARRFQAAGQEQRGEYDNEPAGENDAESQWVHRRLLETVVRAGTDRTYTPMRL